MKRLLILANSDSAIFKFRTELIQALEEEFEIGLGIPFGKYINDIKNDKYKFFDIPVNRHGLNPVEDIILLIKYNFLLKKYRPDLVLTYTIKPNIYGSIACMINHIPCLCNITGLGSAISKPGLLQKILIKMYRFALKKEQTIFFQNEYGRTFFRNHHIGKEEQYYLLPGSGVNLDRFTPMEYPHDKTVRYLFVARIIKEKGIEEFIDVAKRFFEEKKHAEFHICGECEQEYREILQKLSDEKVIIYHGLVKDMRIMYKMASCVVLPSYYPEGQSNVLLEGAASCRPLVTTDHPGCREAVDDDVTGFLVRIKDKDSLYQKMTDIYEMDSCAREKMGQAGRKKMELEFDRQIVIRAYQSEIKKICWK